MKIEWTDDVCELVSRRLPCNWSIGRTRDLLNFATAEQFRPETDAEKVTRYERVLRAIADGSAVPEVHAREALKEPWRSLLRELGSE